LADYYPLIARAIAGLAPNAPGEIRRALYERSRTALIAQLKSVQPPLSEAEITRERLSLEEAIRKLEAETAARADAQGQLEGQRTSELLDDDGPTADFNINRLLADFIQKAPNKIFISSGPPPTSLPPLTIIPEQNEKRAIAFRPSRRGPLELLPDPPKDPLDPEQSQLYSRIRQQIRKLKDDLPSQERSQIDDVLDDFLDQPATWQQIEFKKVLWLCGNALRNALAQHDAVKHSRDPHYSKLPPSVAEALRRPVEAWNVFVLGDTDLVDLDAKRLGPQEQQSLLNDINAARPILENAASDRNITTEQAGNVLNASLHAASIPADNIHTKQAQDVAAGTSKNLIIQLVRRAYLTCQSIADPQNDEDRELVAEYRKGVAKGAGNATVGAAVAAAIYTAPYAASFFEFAVQNATALKGYIAVAFQNPQLGQVIDAIRELHTKLTSNDQP
jgi:hypothetical protein